MEVDEGAEGTLFAAGEEPVDGAFFVGFDVVGDEFGEEVAADSVAGGFAGFEGEGGGDEVEVFGEVGLGVGGGDEGDEAGDDIVVEVGLVGDGEDGVLVGGEGGVALRVEGLSGVDESGGVEGVAAHHAADGVGDEGADVSVEICAADGDLVVGDFGGEFGLESVGFDPVAVVFFFELFELLEGTIALGLPGGEGLRELGEAVSEKGMGLEVPGGFKVVPVLI